MGASDTTLNLKITADGSGLIGELRDALGNVKDFKSGVDDANQSTVAGNDKARASFDALGAAAKRTAQDANSASNAYRAQSSGLADLIGKIDPTIGRLGKLDDQLDALRKFKTSGALSGEDFAGYAAKIEQTRNALTGAGTAQHAFSMESKAAQREVGVLLGELARGDVSRFEKSFITLTRQTGLLTAGMNLLLGPVGLIAGVAVVAGAALLSLASEVSGLNKGIISTGNYAGVTVEQVQQMGTAIGAQTGKVRETRTALTELVTSGKFTGDQLKVVAKGVVDFSTMTGQSVDKAVKEFEKLADEPVKGAAELNKQYHFLTEAVYEQIIAAEKNGNVQQAQALAEKALSDASAARAKETEEHWGLVERTFHAVKDAAAEMWDAILAHGREKTFEEQVQAAAAKVEETRANYEEALNSSWAMSSARVAAFKAEADGAVTELGKLLDSQNKNEVAAKNQAAALKGIHEQENQAAITARTDFDKLTESLDKTAVAQKKIKKAAEDLYAIYQAGGKLPQGINFNGPVADIPVGPGWDKLKAKINENNSDLTKLHHEQDEYNATLVRAAELVSRLGGAVDPVTGAYLKYRQEMIEVNAVEQKLIEVGDKLGKGEAARAAAAQLGTQAHKAALQSLKETLKDIDQQTDVVAKALRQIDADNALAGLTEREREQAKVVEDATKKWDSLKESQRQALIAQGKLNPTTAEGSARLRDAAGSAYDYRKALDFLRQGEQEIERAFAGGWTQTFSAVGQLLTRQIKTFHDFFKSIVDGWKNAVAQMIATSLQMRFLGPIMGAFGFDAAPYGGAGGATAIAQTGSTIMSALGSGGGSSSSAAAAAGGGGFDFSSAASWLNAGKSLFSGFSSGLSTFWNGSSGYFAGPPTAAGVTPGIGNVSPYGGSTLGQGLGIAGGIYAGYNRYQNSGGGFAGAAGGLAYGAGTYALGAGLTSAMAGTGFAAGVSGAFAAIPVVGWVAIAAMVIDKISGGKLFGTKFAPTGNVATNLAVGADGSSLTNSAEEKRNKAWFGGHEWKWVDVAASQEQIDFKTSLDKTILQVRQSAATALAGPLADAISASFKQVVDKSGKVTSQISTVLGKTYIEPMEDFVKRIQAENVIAQVDAAGAAGEASQVAEAYRSNAQTLSDAAQFLLQAEQDVKHNLSLLGDDKSLKDITSVVSGLQQAGESLLQTYTRLHAETDALKNALDLMQVDIGKTGADFVKFADGLAQAAGGSDKLQSLLSGFESAYFSPEEQGKQQAEYFRKLADTALSGLGESVGVSMEQFKADLLAALPKATPEEAAQWLQAAQYLAQATAAEKQYADAVAQTAAKQQAAIDNYNALVDGVTASFKEFMSPSTDFEKALAAINAAEKQTEDQLNAAARAAGMTGAAEKDLATVREYAIAQIARLKQQLQAETESLVSQFNGTTAPGLDPINQQIADLEAQLRSMGSAAGSAGSAISDAANSIQDHIRLLLGDLSPFNDNQKLDIAKQAYLQGNASEEDVLRVAQRLYASSNDYVKVFQWAEANKPSTGTGGGSGGGTGVDTSSIQAQLNALYAQRDKLIAQEAFAQRKELTEKMIASIVDLATSNHIDALAEMDILGVKLVDVVEALGIHLDKIGADDVTKLGELAGSLHVGLSDILAKLGLSLADVSAGIEQIVSNMHIDLSNISSTSLQQLGALAGTLHLSLEDVVASLHLHLGDLSVGLHSIVDSMGINLSNLSADSVKKLTDLAATLHLSLADLGSILGIKLDGVVGTGREVIDTIRAHSTMVSSGVQTISAIDSDIASSSRSIPPNIGITLRPHFDGLPNNIRDSIRPHFDPIYGGIGVLPGHIHDNADRTISAIGAVDSGVRALPGAIRPPQDDFVAKASEMIIHLRRVADGVEQNLPYIADATADGAVSGRRTATATENTVSTIREVSVGGTGLFPDRNIRVPVAPGDPGYVP